MVNFLRNKKTWMVRNCVLVLYVLILHYEFSSANELTVFIPMPSFDAKFNTLNTRRWIENSWLDARGTHLRCQPSCKTRFSFLMLATVARNLRMRTKNRNKLPKISSTNVCNLHIVLRKIVLAVYSSRRNHSYPLCFSNFNARAQVYISLPV